MTVRQFQNKADKLYSEIERGVNTLSECKSILLSLWYDMNEFPAGSDDYMDCEDTMLDIKALIDDVYSVEI
jgi:hypothetical protein